MELKKIQELIKLVNKTTISELTIEDAEGKITIKQKEDKQNTFFTEGYVPIQQPKLPTTPQTTATNNDTKPTNTITIKSPMIGTFYKRPSPDKPNFVEVGSTIEVGKVICIIEAMKLFNEIESDISGTITQILVEDATPVEFDQPLFIVSPK